VVGVAYAQFVVPLAIKDLIRHLDVHALDGNGAAQYDAKVLAKTDQVSLDFELVGCQLVLYRRGVLWRFLEFDDHSFLVFAVLLVEFLLLLQLLNLV